MPKIKILSVTHYSALYGANRSLLNLIEGTRDYVDWTVICRGGGGISGDIRQELARLHVKCYVLPFRVDIFLSKTARKNNSYVFAIELIYNMLFALLISAYARVKNIKFIHSNTTASCLGAYISFISRIPHLWHFREFLDKDYHHEYKFGFKYLAYWANKATYIISISKSIDAIAVKARGINARSQLIYNGVIGDQELPMLNIRKIGAVARLAIVGLIDKSKNQYEAILAVQTLTEKGITVTLDIIGEARGAYYMQLLEYVKQHDLENTVFFKGYKSSQSEIFSQIDITLMCSPNEAMGRVTVESMAHSTPVIGYNSAGTSELIEHGKSGLLYDGDAVELAAAIERLINDFPLYKYIVQNGYNKVKSELTVEHYAYQFLSLLRGIKH
ncbi:glycosyltransferase family 4 protein [Pedobacter sp. SAFR-022]|uniref:glycosyltransferase family 4 protein n=1 Tax=Pedobacter sp. SAFR-022 TaxID=3436861 RepID=UPI003F7E4ED8